MVFHKLTFDIGTKNLAYCLVSFDEDENNVKVLISKTIDVSDYGRMLDRYRNDKSTKTKVKKSKKYTQIEKIQIINGILINMVQMKIISHHKINHIDKVFIEHQCAFAKKIIFSVSHIVYSFFMQMKHNPLVQSQLKIDEVKMVNGSIKLVSTTWNEMSEPTQDYLKFARNLLGIHEKDVNVQLKRKRRSKEFKLYFDAIYPTTEDFFSQTIEKVSEIRDNHSTENDSTNKKKQSVVLRKKLADCNHTKNKLLSIRLCFTCLYYLKKNNNLDDKNWKEIQDRILEHTDKLDDYCDVLNYAFETDLERIFGKRPTIKTITIN